MKEQLLTLHALQKCNTMHKQGTMICNTLRYRETFCIARLFKQYLMINVILSRQRMI